MKEGVSLSKDSSGRIIVAFPYDPQLVAKIKTIEGRKWHSQEKYWSFPNTDGTLEKILEVFEGEEIHVDPALQERLSSSAIVRQDCNLIPTLEKGGEGGFSGNTDQLQRPIPDLRTEQSGVPSLVIASPDKIGTKQSLHNFEDLRRELISRKYSYKTVKGYIYYNRDFLNFIGKNPSKINDSDIKDYLLYLAEEKQAATSTLNQAINALKFYYSGMLKKKFVYEVKRPRKDKKLPVVLSKEEVARILNSMDNLKHKAILMLVYSAGLRVGEVVRLKPEDIDSKRMLIFIKGAKGRKDILP